MDGDLVLGAGFEIVSMVFWNPDWFLIQWVVIKRKSKSVP